MKSIICISPDGRSFTTKGMDGLPDTINISNEIADIIESSTGKNAQMSMSCSGLKQD